MRDQPRKHRFIVCRERRAPVRWEPPAPTDATGHDLAYLGRALAHAAAIAPEPPLTFILTWDVESLPETGEHVVAIVQGDEDARWPSWSNDVLITFKCYGTRPPMMPLAPPPGWLEALELAHLGRRAVRWLPGAAARAWAHGRPWRERPPVVPIPLGYYNQSDHPVVPFHERRWSVSFAGSGVPAAGQRGLLAAPGTPKERARTDMLRALARVEAKLDHEPMTVLAQAGFPALLPDEDAEARRLAPAYTELLAQSRVCLVPRGNSPETFRFFEALRAGCVVICEPLPNHWFYRGAPVVVLRRWRELERVLPALLAAPALLQELHRASLAWWEGCCSELALGRLIAAKIAALRA